MTAYICPQCKSQDQRPRSVSAPLPSSKFRREKRSANTGVALVVSVRSGRGASLAAGACAAGHVAAFHSFTVWSAPPAEAGSLVKCDAQEG